MKSRAPPTADNIRTLLPEETTIRAFFKATPIAAMSHPGASRRTSAMDKLSEEFGPLELGERAKRKLK